MEHRLGRLRPRALHGVELGTRGMTITWSSSPTTMSLFGALRPSSPVLGGLLWKNPWRMSGLRRARARARLNNVDDVIEAVHESGVKCGALDLALQLPKQSEMHPRDKYTVFSPHSRNFRKSAHKVPKWTRLTLRENPRGF